MAGQWDTWLAELKAANKGPVTFRARRLVVFSANLLFPGDWTGTTIRGEIRASPDAGLGAPLAEFNVSAPVVGAETTLFNVALSAGDVYNLPSDADAESDGITTLLYDLLITVPGNDEELLWGGEFVVIGRVTGLEPT